jgi:hypothetical protein
MKTKIISIKSIFYVLLLGVVGCSKPVLVKNNDLEKENLKGKVKSIYAVESTIKNKKGKFIFGRKINKKDILCFNEYGLLTYVYNSTLSDKDEFSYEYDFDLENRIKKQIEHHSLLGLDNIESKFYYKKNVTSILKRLNDTIIRKYIDIYKNELLTRRDFFMKDYKTNKFSLHSYTIYLYNKNKQDSITSYYLYSKKRKAFIIEMQDKYLYDSKNNDVVEHEIYDLWYDHDDPANVEVEHRNKIIYKDYLYKYDKHGNWIEKIVTENGALKGYKRKITYYV